MALVGEAQRVIAGAQRKLRRRLDPATLGINRRGQFPDVWPGSVAVTVGTANVHSTIIDSATPNHLCTNAAFRYFCGTPMLAGSNSPKNSMYIAVPPTGSNTAQPLRVEFNFDGQVLEWWTLGSGGFYRLRVDGALVGGFTSVAGPASNGNTYFIKLDFGSRAPRRIELELANQLWGGVMCALTDTIWRPHSPLGPRVIILGDSFTEGTGATSPLECFGFVLGELLGWRDVALSGVGGTGYVNPGPAGRVKLGDRVAADAVARNPDIALVCMGLNDTSFLQSQIQTEATANFHALLTAPSKPVVIATGAWVGSSGSVATVTTVTGYLAATAASANIDLFIDNIAGSWRTRSGVTGVSQGSWITGSGRVGGTNGTGNADYYRSPAPDGVHPYTDGHTYLGYRLAQAIIAASDLGAF